MGPLLTSFSHSYILIGVKYVCQWTKVIPCHENDHKVDKKFLKENIFSLLGTSKVVISDGWEHISLLSISIIPWENMGSIIILHPIIIFKPIRSQVGKYKFKMILEKVIKASWKAWLIHLTNAPWMYRATYKTHIRMLTYHIIYEECHLLLELKHRAYGAIRMVNLRNKCTKKERRLKLDEI